MINVLKIFGFTILVTAFYSYVGQMVPQTEAYPPEATEFGAEMTTADLVAVGEEIVGGKGTCLACHTIGEEGHALRFPDLGGIGAVAATRREGLSDVDYLAETLYEPNAYIVEGFQPGMPAIHQPPIGLNALEIRAVIAYLQSLGGTPTVTLETELPYDDEAAAAPAPEPPSAAGGEGETPVQAALEGPEIFEQYMCATCHSLDEPMRLVGPTLYDVGSRLSRAELYEAIVDPDATIAEGFPPGLMGPTLEASGFHTEVTPAQLKALVDFLATKTGE